MAVEEVGILKWHAGSNAVQTEIIGQEDQLYGTCIIG